MAITEGLIIQNKWHNHIKHRSQRWATLIGEGRQTESWIHKRLTKTDQRTQKKRPAVRMGRTNTPDRDSNPGHQTGFLGSRTTHRSRHSPALPGCSWVGYPLINNSWLARDRTHAHKRTWCAVMAAIILWISGRVDPSARSKPKSSTTRPHPPSTAHEAVDDGTRITLFCVTCFVSAIALEQVSIINCYMNRSDLRWRTLISFNWHHRKGHAGQHRPAFSERTVVVCRNLKIFYSCL